MQQTDKQKTEKTAKTWWKTALNVLLWVFVAFAILITVLVLASKSDDGIPSVFGRMFITVQSSSMSGTFEKGDMIICEKVSSEEQAKMQVGDVIMFESDLNGDGTVELNTHRITDIINSGGSVSYVTKGDANAIADENPVHNGFVKGKYTETRIPCFGSIMDFLGSPLGFGLIIVLPLILFFFVELYNFISLIKKPKGALSAEDEEEIKRKAIEEYLNSQKTDAEKVDEPQEPQEPQE